MYLIDKNYDPYIEEDYFTEAALETKMRKELVWEQKYKWLKSKCKRVIPKEPRIKLRKRDFTLDPFYPDLYSYRYKV
jgi:hypothetical protein